MSSKTATRDGSGLGHVSSFVRRYFGGASRIQYGLLAVLTVALLTLPVWNPQYLYLFTLAGIWAILAMGWDIISGHTGYISFGHSALSGSAAYTTALLIMHVGELPMYVTFPVSVLAALVVGMLFALPSLRLQGPYFSLMTLLAALLLYRFVYPFSRYTGGELGINISPLSTDPVVRYYMVLVPMLLVAVALVFVSRSNVGMVFRAIRENEAAVESAGLDTTKFKLWAFTLSAVTMGIGGTLLAHFYSNVDPSTVLALDRSIEIIVMAAIGGMGTILGPLAGAYLFVLLRDEFLLHIVGLSSAHRWIALWTIAALILLYSRDGIFPGFWEWIGQFDDTRELVRGANKWLRDIPARVRGQFGGDDA